MALDFWDRLWPVLGLGRGIRVEHSPGGETRIVVEDRIPHLRPRGARRASYGITTTRRMLSTDDFPDHELRGRIGAAAAKTRNRALFITDLRGGEVMSALCFHVDRDPKLAIHLRELALSRSPDWDRRARSRFCAHLLLAYLAEVGAADGRGCRVGFIAEHRSEEELAAEFGFTRARRPDSVRARGAYMLLTPPPRLPK